MSTVINSAKKTAPLSLQSWTAGRQINPRINRNNSYVKSANEQWSQYLQLLKTSSKSNVQVLSAIMHTRLNLNGITNQQLGYFNFF